MTILTYSFILFATFHKSQLAPVSLDSDNNKGSFNIQAFLKRNHKNSIENSRPRFHEQSFPYEHHQWKKNAKATELAQRLVRMLNEYTKISDKYSSLLDNSGNFEMSRGTIQDDGTLPEYHRLSHREINADQRLRHREINGDYPRLPHRAISEDQILHHNETNDDDLRLPHREINTDQRLRHREINGDDPRLPHRAISEDQILRHREINIDQRLRHREINGDDPRLSHRAISEDQILHHHERNDDNLRLPHREINTDQRLRHREMNGDDPRLPHREIIENQAFHYREVNPGLSRLEVNDDRGLRHHEINENDVQLRHSDQFYKSEKTAEDDDDYNHKLKNNGINFPRFKRIFMCTHICKAKYELCLTVTVDDRKDLVAHLQDCDKLRNSCYRNICK